MYIYLISIFPVKATQIYTKHQSSNIHTRTQKNSITDDRERQKEQTK